MTIKRRLVKLEVRREVTGADTGARERLAAMLDRINSNVTAGGDYSHRADASQAENMVRARLRGDSAKAFAVKTSEGGPRQ